MAEGLAAFEEGFGRHGEDIANRVAERSDLAIGALAEKLNAFEASFERGGEQVAQRLARQGLRLGEVLGEQLAGVEANVGAAATNSSPSSPSKATARRAR